MINRQMLNNHFISRHSAKQKLRINAIHFLSCQLIAIKN